MVTYAAQKGNERSPHRAERGMPALVKTNKAQSNRLRRLCRRPAADQHTRRGAARSISRGKHAASRSRAASNPRSSYTVPIDVRVHGRYPNRERETSGSRNPFLETPTTLRAAPRCRFFLLEIARSHSFFLHNCTNFRWTLYTSVFIQALRAVRKSKPHKLAYPGSESGEDPCGTKSGF